jgi:hypothetical protein
LSSFFSFILTSNKVLFDLKKGLKKKGIVVMTKTKYIPGTYIWASVANANRDVGILDISHEKSRSLQPWQCQWRHANAA